MLFLEWTNENIGKFDIFAILNTDEKNQLVTYYKTKSAESAVLIEENKYFYFINSKKKTITPMPMLSLAFGGQYNGEPPYGEEVIDFEFDYKDYKLVLFGKDIENERFF